MAHGPSDGGGMRDRVDDIQRWFTEFGRYAYTTVTPVDLDALEGWSRDRRTGNIHHHSGKFFTIEGLSALAPDGPVPRWTQPIINQPEVGVLGLLVKETGGVLRALVQAKVEPGNRNGLQLSPTVQATRSNYTRVHQGRAVPYLEYFREHRRHRVIADVRQSEQGAWFYRKRNRNMVVETVEDVELLDGFRWLTLGELYAMLAEEDRVNMDLRSVLSCLPLATPGLDTVLRGDGSGFHGALVRSCAPTSGTRHSLGELLNWITDTRTRTDIHTERIPLDGLDGWRRTPASITHESGRFFSVIGVDVAAGGREVAHWTQPMVRPEGQGVIALLVGVIDGVLHALLHACVEPGYLDVAELAPTVQCVPDTLEALPAAARPPFLDAVLRADPSDIRYDTVLSEEGGRFYHALSRYMIVETDPAGIDHPDYRWIAVHQLMELLPHSHYVNVQARSLVTCLHSLVGSYGATRRSTAGVEGS
ncbi:NDP-hexose 2,3-dehydratase family protein [Streptomyces kanamyceticus]|uniref:NDP-hexose 2,3-dehydratase n=1 Tax=Streptomyces kanamyceticus TaxID=1967 RepID=A0A5J6GYD0_STRKN|nr:NDP-hexose 2,3-dehydratase [Streptomyces kanamyceticus]